MLLKEATARLTQSELANIGTGEVAYIRKMDWSKYPAASRKRPISIRMWISGRFLAPTAPRSF